MIAAPIEVGRRAGYQPPREYQFGEFIGAAIGGAVRGPPSHETVLKDATSPAAKYRGVAGCFLLGASLGDDLEDLQERTEDLLEDVATHYPSPYTPTDDFLSLWTDVKTEFGDATTYCGISPTMVQDNLVALDSLFHKPGGLLPEDIRLVRRRLDDITMAMARRENTGVTH